MMDFEEFLLKAHLLARGFDGRLRGYQHYKPHAEKNPKDARYFTRGFVSNDLDELCEEEITYLARKFTR